jgi:hypothetical protein
MTTAGRSSHLEPAVLTDYWLAALTAEAEAAVEEHLLACDTCGDRLREVIALAEGLRALARSGSLRVIVSDGLARHAAKSGLRVREYAPPSGGSVQCTVASDDDLLLARLTADLSTAPRVDLSWCDPHGVELQRMTDVPVFADAGGIICQQSIVWAKGAPSATMIARLLAVDDSGDERLLAEYTFHHTRTIPGPPSS